ncbi:MAG: Hsp20/alpha crystallin family protein [Candidatus Omnitrophica bacterium]|nr:Hsp20/alpha crystallin family protein [Candidatus Omnitrophota bacterium]
MNYSMLSKIVLTKIIITSSLLLMPSGAHADDTAELKNQVATLSQKVADLEKQLASQNNQGNVYHPRPVTVQYVNAMDPLDPLAQIEMMHRQMGQMMKDQMIDFNPQQDIQQTPDAYIVTMDIPGMDKSKINVEVKNGLLSVSGDRSSEVKEDKPNQMYRQERSFGHFYRELALPEDAKSDTIDAQYNNGVLTVKVPRAKSNNPAASGQKILIK